MEILKSLGVGGISPNIAFAPKYGIKFGQSSPADTFERSGTERYTTESEIKRLILANPKLQKMIKEINPKMKLNFEEIRAINETHSKETERIAVGIINNLQPALKSKINLKSVSEASKLHDIGKVFIPKDILNKPAKLDAKETEIMQRHSLLGYELLRSSDIDSKTLELIKYHHQNALKNGYPKAEKEFFADVNLQVLSAADKYSALTEARPYKPAMTSKQALTVIYADVKDGKISPFVFKALADFAGSDIPAEIAV